ncbi:hypothetical protein [Turicimonas muris]|uniref:hypothetical protein n=1 Tax=Turicimonas muris TaxID=1796652 RepID=UPI003F671D36
MTKTMLSIILALGFASVVAAAPRVETPPSIDSKDNISGGTSEKKVTRITAKKTDAVTKEELEQAKKDIEAAKVRQKDPRFWPKTKIEETVNNNNVVTEVKVTPMSTQIPYTMTREQPSNQSKNGTSGDNTMSVPKIINFGF